MGFLFWTADCDMIVTTVNMYDEISLLSATNNHNWNISYHSCFIFTTG